MTRLALALVLALVACGGDPPDPTATLTLADTTHVLVPPWTIGCRDVTECRSQSLLDRWPQTAFNAVDAACVEGRCVLVCLAGVSANCDGNTNNGCEARTATCP